MGGIQIRESRNRRSRHPPHLVFTASFSYLVLLLSFFAVEEIVLVEPVVPQPQPETPASTAAPLAASARKKPSGRPGSSRPFTLCASNRDCLPVGRPSSSSHPVKRQASGGDNRRATGEKRSKTVKSKKESARPVK